MKKSILIIGGGFGLSWSSARLFSKEGMDVSIASRNIEKYANLDSEIKLNLYNCDASIIEDVNKLFENIDKDVASELTKFSSSPKPSANGDPLLVAIKRFSNPLKMKHKAKDPVNFLTTSRTAFKGSHLF